MTEPTNYDVVIVGSGFGGAPSALRLAEKGYSVLVLEKGRRFQPEDFPKTNWNLKRWMWMPQLGWRGLFKMTFLPHITALSGVGVGGGSLTYANTLPLPKSGFFSAPSWAHLGKWADELAPHYDTAQRMLGATKNELPTYSDEVIREVAEDLGREDKYELTNVAVFFGKSGETVPDPYFGGEGPARTGCNGCGGCMLGCRYGAKNTLDRNYLFLAEKRGVRVNPDTEVTWVRPLPTGGYRIDARHGTSAITVRNKRRSFTAKHVIFAGGVLGTVPLLLKLKRSRFGLPNLSDHVGRFVRTNSEVLMGIVSRDHDMSQGIAIGSILHTDDHSHVEPVRYPAGAGFFRLMAAPHATGNTLAARLTSSVRELARHPMKHFKASVLPDWARYTLIMLYMRTLDGHLTLKLGRGLRTGGGLGLSTELSAGPSPTASIPEADEIGQRIADKVGGVMQSMVTETLQGIPTTAHILGGCCMGRDETEGVIDAQHRVHGYDGLYVIDGSAVSANPGVNPALTITALAERAASFFPPRS